MDSESIPVMLLKSIFRKNIFTGVAFVIASQLLSSVQSYKNLSTEMDKLKIDLHESIVKRDKLFSKKSDIKAIVGRLDQMNQRLTTINKHLQSDHHRIYTSAIDNMHNI